MSFGRMPIANGFIKSQSEKEFFYELAVYFCPACFMVQLGETVKPEQMFNEHYHFISSTSSTMAEHFKKMAGEIETIISGKRSPFAVELGCNDGIMLKHLVARKIKHLGVEPSANVADLARKNKVEVTEKFFNAQTAGEIAKKYGRADVISGANVMCHIENINSVFEGVNVLLKEKGVFFFEDPYFFDIVLKNSFDQIYDEHVYYFSGLSISKLAERHNLTLTDMRPQEEHGGSMRYYLKKGREKPAGSVIRHILREKKANLDKKKGYLDFKKAVNRICGDLNLVLKRLKADGNRIAGYGATSKSTTLLNYAEIGPDIIEYISDITPTKINKFTPGMHIPVKAYDFFLENKPDYMLLLAWNHKKEILKKEKPYRDGGGKFITYFPKVTVE